jgi:hypothetical protein
LRRATRAGFGPTRRGSFGAIDEGRIHSVPNYIPRWPGRDLRSTLALAPVAAAALLIAAEAGQRAVDTLPAAEAARLARGASRVPRSLVECRSGRGWLHPSRTTTTCVREGLTVPVRWTRTVWHGQGPDHVEREWEEPEHPWVPFFPGLTGAGRCTLFDPDATDPPRARWLRASLAPGGVTLLRCDVGPSGVSPPEWTMALRERPRRGPSWVALAAAIVATINAARALRGGRCRLPWRLARLGPDGVHRLDDGRPVRPAWAGEPAEVHVVLKDAPEAPYRAEEALATSRAETAASRDARRARAALALSALAWGLTAAACALR